MTRADRFTVGEIGFDDTAKNFARTLAQSRKRAVIASVTFRSVEVVGHGDRMAGDGDARKRHGLESQAIAFD